MPESSDSEPETSRAPPPLLEGEATTSGNDDWAEQDSIPSPIPSHPPVSSRRLQSEEDPDEREAPPPPLAPPVGGMENDTFASRASSKTVVSEAPPSSQRDTPEPEAMYEKTERRPSSSPSSDTNGARRSHLTPSPPPGKPENSAPRPRPGAAAAEIASEMAREEAIDLKKALMRKVAQLTKVVVHLNAKNDEGEARAEKIRAGFEEEIRTVVQDAMLKAGEYRKEVAEILAADQFKADLDRQAELLVSVKAEKRLELGNIRSNAMDRQENLVEQGSGQIQRSVKELRGLETEMRTSMEAFRQALGQSRAELERRDSEIRDRRAAELQALAAEYERRLNDVRAAHAREIESLIGAKEQALSHMTRLHESEMTMLKMQALQQRREKAHKLEQEFLEEKRESEQLISHLRFELDQQQHDTADALNACKTTQQQIDGMRTSLHEMTLRVEAGERESSSASEEAALKEAEAAALQGEVTVLQVRQKASGIISAGFVLPPGVAPVPAKAEPAEGTDLSKELREAIEGANRLEVEIDETDAILADLDDDLTAKEKQLEILEVEIEEERLRNHQLQARILEREAAIKS